MERISNYIGIPVICKDTSKKAGEVKEILFSREEKEIKAFMVGISYNLTNRILPYENISNINNESIIIEDNSKLIVDKNKKFKTDFNEIEKLKNIEVYSLKGHKCGEVKDAFFDPTTGKIEAIEVSMGYIDDIIRGRNIVPLFAKTEISEELIILDNESLEEMMNTGGGIINIRKRNNKDK